MPEREFLKALDVLLDTGAYTAGRPYFQLGARNAARRRPSATHPNGRRPSCGWRTARARDAWVQAVTHLKRDPWAVTQALSNLGTTWLRLDDLPAAERALARAVALSGGPHTRGQLSVAWRGLGAFTCGTGNWSAPSTPTAWPRKRPTTWP